VQKETLLSWVGAAWMVIHTYLGGAGWSLSLAGVWVSYRAVEKMLGIIGDAQKRKKTKKKVGVGGKEEEGRGERAALKTKSIVGCMFRKLKSKGGVLFWGISCFARVRRGKNESGVGKCFHFSVSFLSLFPPFSLLFLIVVCMCGYLRGNSSFSFSCVVVMRFVGITGMGFHLFYFVSLGTRRKSRGFST
jgi:hypothetical protein